MASSEAITILIVEDNEVTRIGLRLLLNFSDGVKVLGEAVDGREGVAKTIELKPQVVLMDIAMPIMDGIAATNKIKTKCPGVKIIMLTSHQSDRDVFSSVEAGADGFCLKDVEGDDLVKAIKMVATGVPWIDPRISPRLMEKIDEQSCRLSQPIDLGTAARASHRVVRNLSRKLGGFSRHQVSAEFIDGLNSVKCQMKLTMKKMSVSNFTQAAMKAIREGWA